MATSLLSPSTVRQIAALRLDGFETSYAVANPQSVLVLDRNGIEIDAQRVLVDWVGRRASRFVGGLTAMRETDADIVFRRPTPFDVKADDRFNLREIDPEAGIGSTGTITRITPRNGLIYADATIDIGSGG